jgi:predicted NBD/HSP70 family sugar kinase
MSADGALSLNERGILDCVRRQGALPRTDIASLMGLTDASVSRLTRNLETRGLVRERVPNSSSGQRGSPKRPLVLNENGAYSLGVDFSPSHLDVGLLNLVGDLVWQGRTEVANPSVDDIADLTRSFIRQLADEIGVRAQSICGLGIAVPGYRSVQHGSFAVHPDFDALLATDLQADLQHALGLPVVVERDAVAAALGEKLLGHSRDGRSICFIYIGQGIGGAFLSDGRIVHGAHGNAGGIGALFPDDRRRPSGDDLFAFLGASGISVESFAELEALDPGQGPLRQWIVEAGRELRGGVAILGRLFDPHMVIVGGRLPIAVSQALVSEIGVLDRPPHYTDDIPFPDILSSAFGPICGLIGAASLPLQAAYFL